MNQKEYLCVWKKCLKRYCICIEKREITGEPFSWQIWECTRTDENKEIEWSTPRTRRIEKESREKEKIQEPSTQKITSIDKKIQDIERQIQELELYEHVETCDCFRYKTIGAMIKNIKWMERNWINGPFTCIKIRLEIIKYSLWKQRERYEEELYYKPGNQGYLETQEHFLSLVNIK